MISWILESPIIPALGWSVLHAIWQVFILGALAFLGLKIISIQKANARYLFSYIMLFFIGGVFIWNFNHQYQIASSQKDAVEVSLDLNGIPETASAGTIPSLQNPDLEFVESDAKPIISGKSAFSISDWLLNAKPFLVKSLPWLALIWLIGVFVLGFRLIASWWYLNRWSKQDAIPVSTYWQQKLDQLKNRLRISTAIRFLESSKISEPMTFGWLKPVIMVPLGMLSQLPPDQVEAVLLHELAHIRRFDFIANILQSMIEILLFFHPVVWWLSRKIRESREDCCDDIAAYYCGDQHQYARSLLQVQKFSFNYKNQLAMNASGNSGRLTARIQRLFLNSNPANHSNRKRITPLLSLLLIFSFLSLYAFTDIFSGNKTVSISADKMNVFYIGVDNPVTAAVAGIPSEKIRLSSKDVMIEPQGSGHYKINATKPGKAILTVSGEGLETTDVEFRVKRLPDPIAVLSVPGYKSSGGAIDAEEFKKVRGVTLDFGNFAFDVDMQVVGYTMTRVGKKEDPAEAIVRQADFSEQARLLADQAKTGDIYYFDNVKASSRQYSGQDKEVVLPVNSMVFKIK